MSKYVFSCYRNPKPDLANLAPQSRDLARTRPACLLDRQFPEKLFFGQRKNSMKNSQFLLYCCYLPTNLLTNHLLGQS